MKNKTIVAGLAAGAIFFLLGWVVYGFILKDFMESNYNNCANRPMEDMIWWALIVSQFVWGFLLAMILGWANARTFSSGMQKGLIVGVLISAAYDLSMHSMLTVFLTMNALVVDIVVNGVMCAIAGGVIGMILGSEKNNATS